MALSLPAWARQQARRLLTPQLVHPAQAVDLHQVHLLLQTLLQAQQAHLALPLPLIPHQVHLISSHRASLHSRALHSP